MQCLTQSVAMATQIRQWRREERWKLAVVCAARLSGVMPRSSATKLAVMRDVGGLVGLAAERDGREERRVGFDQDAVGGRGGGDRLDGRRTSGRSGCRRRRGRSRGRASGSACVFVAGEAVHDAGQAGRRPVLGEEARAGRPRRPLARILALAAGVASSEVRQWMSDGLAGRGGDAASAR